MSNRVLTEVLTKEDKEFLIAVLSNFETRSNKDILRLMAIAFEAGFESDDRYSFTMFMDYIKRELLEL